MSKRKGDFRSKIDSILAEQPAGAPAGDNASGLDRMFGASSTGRPDDDALSRHVAPTTETKLDEIEISRIKLPRGRRTDADSELTDSITRTGILQPLLLRPAGNGFEVLDGGRRLVVARERGLKTVPAVVRTIADAEARAMSAERKASVAGTAAAAKPTARAKTAATSKPAATAKPAPVAKAAPTPVAAAPAARAARKPAAIRARPVAGVRGRAAATATAPAAAAAGAAAAASAARPAAARKVAAKPVSRTARPVAGVAAPTRGRPKASSVSTTPGKAKPAPTSGTTRSAAKAAAAAPPVARAPRKPASPRSAAISASSVPATSAGASAARSSAPRKSPAKPRAAETTPAPATLAAVQTAAPERQPAAAFGEADDTLVMSRPRSTPSLARLAPAEPAPAAAEAEATEKRGAREEETTIWRRPEPVPAAPATTSFPRPVEQPAQRQAAAASARGGDVAVGTAGPSRVLADWVCLPLAAGSVAFAVTNLVLNNMALFIESGVVCIVALVLFGALYMAGRRA
jgi:hypothetical protein